MTLIAPHITAYLRERLPNERKASPHTCDTYAYAFQLLFQFASQRLGCSPAALQLEQLDAPLVLAFLEHLQAGRRNGPSTRNARLEGPLRRDRKSTRLNSSHGSISYAVFCLKKKQSGVES